MNAPAEIQKLNDAGYQVRVRHSRRLGACPTCRRRFSDWRPRGGKTVVEIYKRSDDPAMLEKDMSELVAAGQAICSKKDNFNRGRGLEIALARAIKQMKKDTKVNLVH